MFAYLHALHREGGRDYTHACIMKKGQRWGKSAKVVVYHLRKSIEGIIVGNIYTLQHAHCTLHVYTKPPHIFKTIHFSS